MEVREVIWLDIFIDKLWRKHRVMVDEVEQVLLGRPRIRRVARGDIVGEDVYSAMGQTTGGRYLIVFFVLKPRACHQLGHRLGVFLPCCAIRLAGAIARRMLRMTKQYALRDDRWERIQALLPGRVGHGGARRKITVGLWKRDYTAIALAFPGATCLGGLGSFA